MADHSYDTPAKDRPGSTSGESDFPEIQGGRYRFIEVIGSGGAGTVYRALDTTLDKHVAVKKLHDSATDKIAVRFQREARLAGSLNHPNVMAAKDFGLTALNEPYLILDFVEGQSLSRLIRRVGALPVRDALGILIQLASGLAHAHQRNIIHRDVKPSNVMLVSEKDPGTGAIVTIAKIVDLGLAKALDEDQVLTKSKTAIGTPRYMSPEQIRGIDVDQRSDIYSFGCLMFEVLTGETPFSGETALDVADMHINGELPTLESRGAECSAGMERIVNRCLRKKPSERYHSFEAIQSRLEHELESIETLNSSVVVEGTENEAQPREIDSKTNKTGLILLSIFGGIGVVLLAVLVVLSLSEPGQPEKFSRAKPVEKPVEMTFLGEQKIAFLKHFDMQARMDKSAKGVWIDGVGGGDWIVNDATDDDLAMLNLKKHQSHENITHIDLSSAQFTIEGYKRLNEMGTVKAMSYSSKTLSAEEVKNFAAIKTLEVISFGGMENFDPACLLELKTLNSLNKLELHGLKLDERALKIIGGLHQLERVNLADCTGLTPQALKHLTKLEKLYDLKFETSDITDDGVEAISTCELYILNLTNTKKITNKSLKHLEKMKTLMLLLVESDPQFDPDALNQLEKAIPGIQIPRGKLRSYVDDLKDAHIDFD